MHAVSSDEAGRECVVDGYSGFSGVCGNRTLNRFLIVTLCLENLSSGEKRAVKTEGP